MIPLFNPQPKLKHIYAVAKQMKSGQIGSGRAVYDFEQMLCEYTGKRFCLCTNSGTSALLLAMMALDLPKSTTINIPTYSMAASANVCNVLGYKINLVDNMTVSSGNTINVEMNGTFGVEGDAIIHDHSQCFGLSGEGNIVYSFSPQKTLTTGQGGALLTDDRKIFMLAERFRNQGRLVKLDPTYGLNLRMCDLQAVWGAEQLKEYEETKLKRLEMGEWYNGIKWGAWLFYVNVDNPDGLVVELKRRGIEASRLYKPLHMTQTYKQSGDFPHAMKHYNSVVYLPSWIGLKKQEVKKIVEIVNEAMYQTIG